MMILFRIIAFFYMLPFWFITRNAINRETDKNPASMDKLNAACNSYLAKYGKSKSSKL